jgi:2-iminobutanoate/2-iminopropanoate deaminase
MNSKQAISTVESPPATGPFSQAMMKNGLLFTSGLMPFLPESGNLVGDDLEEQIHQCMRNMKAVLAAAGMTMEDLIMVTIYTTEMQDFATLNRVYGSYFEGLPVYPSRAVLGISALPKAAKVELTAIAGG